MVIVRRATEKDVFDIAAMLKELEIEENDGQLRYPVLGAESTVVFATRLWLKDESRRFFIAEGDEGPVGFVHGVLAMQPHMVPPVVLGLESIFVRPEARKTKAAHGLIKALKDWATSYTLDEGGPLIKFAQWSARPTEKQINRYTRKGAKLYAVMFYKRLEDDLL